MKISNQFKYILFSLWLGFSVQTFAQAPTDTISLALELHDKGLYKQEFKILQTYRITHAQNVDVEWLYGQAAFFLGKTKLMISVYENNILLNNENYYLKLDYAYKLLELGQLQKAKYLLEQFIPYDSKNAQIYASLAKIAYWQSNYNSAYTYINKALFLDSQNADYVELRNSIKLAKAAWVEFGTQYYNDNQPLQNVSPFLKAGIYKNQYCKLQASVQSALLNSDSLQYNAQFYKLRNTSVFAKAGITLYTEAGAITYPNNKTNATALVQLNKTVFNTLTFSAIAERKPYISMLSSLDTSIATSDFTAQLKWQSKKGILAQAAHTYSEFDDKNNITTSSAWIVSPVLQLGKIGLRAGYGYSYTNSKTDMFTPVKSASELFSQIYTDANIEGAFVPYLTPTELQTNSLIGVLNYKVSNKIKLSVSGSYGFLASIQKPYLIGYYNSQNQVEISKFFYKESFTTLDLTVKVDYKITDVIQLKFEYQHSQPNYYYTSDYASVGVKFILNND